jgi:hypothetical protein
VETVAHSSGQTLELLVNNIIGLSFAHHLEKVFLTAHYV